MSTAATRRRLLYRIAYLWTVDSLAGAAPVGQSAVEYAERVAEELRPVLRLRIADMVLISEAVADALEGRPMRP